MNLELDPSTTKTHLFRPDIQGLRGLSVLIVVLYHMNLDVPSGFVGVDVFFTISGFVIAGSISNTPYVDWKRFLSGFYLRRIRRLLPLFILVNGFTLIASLFFSNPFGEIQQVAKASIASFFFVSNYFFMIKDSYWDLVDHPLRHLWSLSVEEQFYFALPLFFVVCKSQVRNDDRRSKVWIIGLAFSTFISLVICLYLTKNSSRIDAANFGFFSSFTRSWQFLSGFLSFYACIPFRKYSGRFFGALFYLLGWLSLLYSLFSIDSAVGWPSRLSVLLTCSICILLIAGSQRSFFRSPLTIRPLVWIGDHSYGWYLWHWPILVFGRELFSSSFLSNFGLAVFALVLSSITKPYVEDRFHNFPALQLVRLHKRILFNCVLVLAMAVALLGVSSTGLGLEQSLSATDTDNMVATQYISGGCYDQPVLFEEIENFCSNKVSSDQLGVLLIGDSQAPSISDGIFEVGRDLGIKVVGLGLAGCPFASRLPITTSERCVNFQKLYVAAITRLQPKYLVVAQRADTYISSFLDNRDLGFPSASGSRPVSIADQKSNLLDSYFSAISDVARPDMAIFVVKETKRVVMPPQTLFELATNSNEVRQGPTVQANNDISDELFSELAKRYSLLDRVSVVDPSLVLCQGSQGCSAEVSGSLLYRDSNHLNHYGSVFLTKFWRDLFSN